ncbi:MAG: Rne/Rng family ribonuclease [Bacteroidetes bacterium]|nr:Rne/Rng family ribonuclease [Bacteroidota bacterium]
MNSPQNKPAPPPAVNRFKVKKEIFINVNENEMRIAITEDNRMAELYVETPDKVRTVGDIYLGRVQKVMPGIRAAFVDIGQPIDGFLHFSDVANNTSEFSALIGDEEGDYDTSDSDSDDESDGSKPQDRQRQGRPKDNPDFIPDLERDQEILVQIVKEPIAKKGSRITTNLTLAGRFVVLMPFSKTIGVSKKIYNYKEKRRLRRIVSEMLTSDLGAIIRTNAENVEEEIIRKDITILINKWKGIQDELKDAKPPKLVYKDATMISSVMRDLLNDQVDRIVIDDKKTYKQIKSYISWTAPHLEECVYYYKGREPIFDAAGIEKDVESAFSRKVWLKSGGYIIIEQTEAMVVIDVNSGRYAAKKEQEMNSLKTNLEAAREICHQLRLRDIGGIIVVDFIDLQDEKNKKKIYDELKKEFKKDRAKSNVVPMTEFGLIQITRQRIRPSVLATISEACPMCAGTGLVQAKSNTITSIERWIQRFMAATGERKLEVKVHPTMAGILNAGYIFSTRYKWMFRYRMLIRIEQDPAIHLNDFRAFSVARNLDVTDEFMTESGDDHEDHRHD